MIHARNIVCVASNWFEHPTSKQHVMRILARRNHVLWVNFHASRRPALTRGDAGMILRRLRQVARGAQRVAPTLDVLSPLLVPLPASPAARRLNGAILCGQIRRALRRLPGRPAQLWLFTPDVPELIGALRAECTVYYCVDDFAAFTGFDADRVERLERDTVARSDVVIATSRPLYDRHHAVHGNVHLVPHGVDVAHFARARTMSDDEIPADIRAIPRPIFGFMGLLTDWVDLELVAAAGRRRPDWSFVLLGDARRDVACLHALPNVHRLGGRPYEQLPAYCRAFDVGLIPFRMSRLVRAVNPIKLREYLAAGLPVVSSPMDSVRPYAAGVETAETLDEFVGACERALRAARERPAAERQALVRAESWDARVETLSGLVEHTPSPALTVVR